MDRMPQPDCPASGGYERDEIGAPEHISLTLAAEARLRERRPGQDVRLDVLELDRTGDVGVVQSSERVAPREWFWPLSVL